MYNLTHVAGPLVCQIRQVLTSCTIRHIFLVPWSDTPRDQENVSDCTWWQNLSNLTHEGTRKMCQIVHDVRTCLIWHTNQIRQVLTSCTIRHIFLVPWCVRLNRFWHHVQSEDQGNVSDCTWCQNLSNLTHQGTRKMCQIVHDVRTCLIWHTKGPGKCVWLYMMSEPVGLDRFWHHVQSDTFSWSLGVSD
jgi:hypothetical protein